MLEMLPLVYAFVRKVCVSSLSLFLENFHIKAKPRYAYKIILIKRKKNGKLDMFARPSTQIIRPNDE